MAMSLSGEDENQECGGENGGNDCLWWCCKVGICVHQCV